MKNLQMSVSPHITARPTTRSIMIEVVIALLPAVIASVVFYGFYALFITLLSVGAAVFGEALYNMMRKRKQTIGDFSAVVTGVLLGLNLPVTVPFYVPIIGGFFATMVVKMLFGGIGRNFANPALTARIFLLLAWAGFMTSFVSPINWANGEAFKYFECALKGADGVAVVTSATRLSDDSVIVPVLDAFLGRTGGSLGETSALALLIGGIFLAIRKIIDWKIPVVFIATTAFFTLVFGKFQNGAELPLLLFSGGLMLGSIFMATDYSTSPNTFWGVMIYAFGCGFLTALIRSFGGYPEGVSFAIVLMNILTPLLDKFILPKPFGKQKKEKVKEAK
ncbi:MAG: RnfABCDGE type electron transport complex subunit D [Clostridia bacterium]|nr:RnfABCDGE type electron transport complex subunit D [Clostridia bacterium]